MSHEPTIVLVHGAFADASSWSGVVERLLEQGHHVIAPAVQRFWSDTRTAAP